MLTNPSTLGLFDEDIEEIERIFHGAARSCTTTART
jgi:glycine cleavage system protein P-like pyridoxal-binding family